MPIPKEAFREWDSEECKFKFETLRITNIVTQNHKIRVTF